MRWIYYYKFGLKTTKMNKKWIYYHNFGKNPTNYKKMSFTKKTYKNRTALMAIFCGKSMK